MKKENEKAKKLLKTAAATLIRGELTGWPPDCIGFAYQPMRPMKCIKKEGGNK